MRPWCGDTATACLLFGFGVVLRLAASASISGSASSCSRSSTSSLLPAAASTRRRCLLVAVESKAMVGSVVVEAELAAVAVVRKERGSG